jgi:hypothetical protein
MTHDHTDQLVLGCMDCALTIANQRDKLFAFVKKVALNNIDYDSKVVYGYLDNLELEATDLLEELGFENE